MLRSLGAVDRSDIALLLLDGPEGYRAGCCWPAILIAPARAGAGSQQMGSDRSKGRDPGIKGGLRSKIAFAGYAPVAFISALTGYSRKGTLPYN